VIVFTAKVFFPRISRPPIQEGEKEKKQRLGRFNGGAMITELLNVEN
jgi:hypothetical protein